MSDTIGIQAGCCKVMDWLAVSGLGLLPTGWFGNPSDTAQRAGWSLVPLTSLSWPGLFLHGCWLLWVSTSTAGLRSTDIPSDIKVTSEQRHRMQESGGQAHRTSQPLSNTLISLNQIFKVSGCLSSLFLTRACAQNRCFLRSTCVRILEWC